MSDPVLLIDNPLPKVRRFTLNRPDKRNALNDDLRGALFTALREGDKARDVSVMIIRGAGSAFCAGYDLGSPNSDVERAISRADGWWSRHVVNNWFEMWDMSTPIIGQVQDTAWLVVQSSQQRATLCMSLKTQRLAIRQCA